MSTDDQPPTSHIRTITVHTKPVPKTPTLEEKAGSARPKGPRYIPGPLPRLENGILDVDHEREKHWKTIYHNAQTVLLQLPGEIRNIIWEHVLGGHNITVLARRKIWRGMRLYKAGIIKLDLCLALVETCRQIYVETALLPIKLNRFSFTSQYSLRWLDNFPSRTALETVREICLIVPNGDGFGMGISRFHPMVKLIWALPLELLPSLQRVVVELHRDSRAMRFRGSLYDWVPQERVLKRLWEMKNSQVGLVLERKYEQSDV